MSATHTVQLSPAEAFDRALLQGRLDFQECDCGHRWLPPRDACPACLRAAWRWCTSSGRGRLISWVVYRVAYDERYKDRLPYNVAIVELEENVRVITNIAGHANGAGLSPDMAVELTVEVEEGVALARFVPSTAPFAS